MELNDQIMKQAQSTNKRIENFLSNINYHIKKFSLSSNDNLESFDTNELYKKLLYNLEMDFDTPKAIGLLLNLIDHIYEHGFNYSNLAEIQSLVSTFLFSLGLNFHKNVLENLGEYQVNDFVESIIQIRNEIRQLAQSVDKPIKIQLFKLSDKIRDQYMPNLKVKMEDLPDSKVKWNYIK
jgi:cysteinyl-tRNA synthetase